MINVKYDFSGKSVLLIGGTTGIGRATALAFAKSGANLFVSGLGKDAGAALVKEVRDSSSAEVEFAEVDVRDAGAMKVLHDRAFERFGRIDIAFNNAGVPGKTAPVQDLDEADFYELIDVNLKGIFLGLKYQVPHMTAAGGGAIVNTSSLFGVMGFATTAVYCASKWGVIGLTNSVALEVARKNIRVNAIAPGSVMTPLLQRHVRQRAEREGHRAADDPDGPHQRPVGDRQSRAATSARTRRPSSPGRQSSSTAAASSQAPTSSEGRRAVEVARDSPTARSIPAHAGIGCHSPDVEDDKVGSPRARG